MLSRLFYEVYVTVINAITCQAMFSSTNCTQLNVNYSYITSFRTSDYPLSYGYSEAEKFSCHL